MTLSANGTGVLSGQFQIPAVVPSGTKLVSFSGAHGSQASAYFTGLGERETVTKQKQITEYYQPPPPNKAPLARGDAYTTPHGATLSVTVSSGVLANDSDPEGDSLRVIGTTSPSNGTVTMNANGSFTYVPNAGYSGVDVFSYSVSDGEDVSVATVMVTVAPPPNSAPTVRGEGFSTTIGVAVTGNVLANDSDPDGDFIFVASNTNPSHGTVTVASNGAFTYTPSAGFAGSDSFTYTVRDTAGNERVGTCRITVNNTPPVAKVDAASVFNLAGQTVTIDVLANDTDAESQPLRIVSITQPSRGTATIVDGARQRIVYRRTVSFGGSDAFTYTIEDSGGARATATVNISVVTPVFVDPLAQTFALAQKAQIGAIDLWVDAVGSTDLVVQIRDVELGFPTNNVLAEARIARGALVAGFNRAVFPWPVTLMADQNYAFVAMCGDADTAIGLAELGKFDTNSQSWVTSQPYTIGVMLSSSNNATWTAHQDRDLTFRLLECRYTSNERTIDLGAITLDGATDLMVSGSVHLPDEGTAVSFEVELPTGTIYSVSAEQPIRLSAPVSGDATVRAILRGTERFSPVLFPDVSLVHGAIASTGTYVSRAMKAGLNSRVRVIFEGLIPAGANVAVEVSGIDEGDAWAAVPSLSAAPLDNGWVEYVYEAADVDELFVRTRLTLSGNAGARPFVKNLRVLVM